jgi:hypothetical protein
VILCTEADGAIVAKLIDFGLVTGVMSHVAAEPPPPNPCDEGVAATPGSLAHRISPVRNSSPEQQPTRVQISFHWASRSGSC